MLSGAFVKVLLFTKTKEWKLDKLKLTQLNARRCFETAIRATKKTYQSRGVNSRQKLLANARQQYRSRANTTTYLHKPVVWLTSQHSWGFWSQHWIHIFACWSFEWVEFFGIFCRDREQGYERQRFGGHVMVPPPSLWKFHLSLQSAPWDKRYGQQESTDARFDNTSVDVSWVSQSSDSLVRVTGIPSNNSLRAGV